MLPSLSLNDAMLQHTGSCRIGLDEDKKEDALRELIRMVSDTITAFNTRVRDNCIAEADSVVLMAATSQACDAVSDGLKNAATKEHK